MDHPSHTSPPYLVYAQRFDCVGDAFKCKPDSGLFRLRRAQHAHGQYGRLGAITEASRIRIAVDVAPCFGPRSDHRYTATNSIEIADDFNLNKYWSKETFYLLSGY